MYTFIETTYQIALTMFTCARKCRLGRWNNLVPSDRATGTWLFQHAIFIGEITQPGESW